MPHLTVRDGAQIYYKDWGAKTGSPIFFSHGWPLNADSWDRQLFYLASQGFRCVAYDRRGHGRSEETWEGNDVDSWADDIAEIVDHLDLKVVTLVGHSTGGSDLVRYVTRHGQDRVSKFVLIACTVPGLIKSDRHPMGHDIKDMDGYRSMLLSNPPGFFREMAYGPFFGFNRPNANVDQAWIDEWLHMSMQTGLKAAHDTTFAWHQYYGDEMAAIDRPVLLLQGDDDQIVDIKMSSLESIKMLKQGTLKIYPGGPHAIPNLKADEVNQDIINFIRTGKV